MLLERYRSEAQKSTGPYKLHRVIQPSKTLADKLALGTSVFFECVSPGMRLRCSSGFMPPDIFRGVIFLLSPAQTYLPV